MAAYFVCFVAEWEVLLKEFMLIEPSAMHWIVNYLCTLGIVKKEEGKKMNLFLFLKVQLPRDSKLEGDKKKHRDPCLCKFGEFVFHFLMFLFLM